MNLFFQGRGLVTVLVLGLFVAISGRAQTTRYVDVDATGSNTGTSWVNAYSNLQSALNAVVSGDQIWVAEGTYYPTNNSTASAHFLLRPGVALRGGFVGTESTVVQRIGTNHPSILSGDIGTPGFDGDNCEQVVLSTGATGALLDRFILTKARNTNKQGGGMNVAANLALRQCIFVDNSGYEGSGLHVGSAGVDNLSTIDSCIFINNTSSRRAGAVQNYGVVNSDNGPTFANCLFVGNVCQQGGNLAGGAMSLYHNRPRIVHCTFIGNSSDAGDAIYASASVYVEASNCIFWDTGDHGGGIFVKQSSNPARFTSTLNCDVRGGFLPPSLGSATDNIDADPLFVNELGSNYRLKQASPCINTGVVIGSVTNDLDGGTRPTGAGYDMGAYEFGSVNLEPPTGLMINVR